MDTKEIVRLAILGLNVSLSMLRQLSNINAISPEDKAAIDAKLREVRESVTPLTDEDISFTAKVDASNFNSDIG